jgi:two-component system sensor histidine kinase AgrC
MLFIYLILLTLAMLSIAYAGIHAAKKKTKEKQYLELEGYTNHLEDLHRNISGFKHDYVNILSALMGYIESEDYKGLKNHLTHVISPYSNQIMVENQSFSALINVKIPSLKGILTVKLLEIYRLKLNHRLEIVEPIEKIHMDLVDLSRMFGILMDNAIEATSLSQEKHLTVALIKNSGGLTIIVENTCPENLLPTHEMYEEKNTSKDSSRGLGLYHYKEMARTYKNVFTETLVENKIFKQVLTIASL